jgi:hypothetical protein
MTEGVDDFTVSFQVAAGLMPRVGVADPYGFATRSDFTVNTGTDVITGVGAHVLDGHEVKVHNVGGGLPAPLVAGTSYYIRDKSGVTSKLALTPGGAAIDITTAGTGTHYISNIPISVEWTRETPVDGSFNYLGLPGTVTEIWRSFGIEIPEAGRTDVDVGFARPGPRYTILLAGSECSGYVDYTPSGGHKPRFKIPAPSTGFPFPLRLAMHASHVGSLATNAEIRNVMLGGNLGEKSILSTANKAKWGVDSDHLHLRIYQTGIVDGFPVDIDL